MKHWYKNLKVSIIILLFSFLPFVDITKPFSGVMLQKAIGNDKGFSVQSLSNYDLLHNLVVIPENIENTLSLTVMLNRINRIDRSVLQLLVNQGVKIRLFEGSLTDEPLLFHLRGEKPRGWEKDITWDDVPGAGGNWLISAKIGASMPGSGHGSINLELHEIGHTVYRLLLTNERFAEKIEFIWKEEVHEMFPEKDYFIQYPSEYFSEMFAYYYYSKRSNYEMRNKAPLTYAFFERFQQLNGNEIEPNYFY
ncbi:hypothetical protein JOC48_000350 [Aquibacillus albus]|uniref:ATLF-like domain-containing protein n=2 Tax=Aquibacillus albus TaxID=1168171 RepID=A0ABS2MVM0_9BACI|nr:hypothetical protein [Aquibacillus albus]